jgi:hypothetical protein
VAVESAAAAATPTSVVAGLATSHDRARASVKFGAPDTEALTASQTIEVPLWGPLVFICLDNQSNNDHTAGAVHVQSATSTSGERDHRCVSRASLPPPPAAIVTVPLVATQAVAQAPMRFGWVQYDSPGSDDGSNASLNAEWVRIKNHGSTARILTGWTVHDLQGHVYTFPSFGLGPGHTVRIHTG